MMRRRQVKKTNIFTHIHAHTHGAYGIKLKCSLISSLVRCKYAHIKYEFQTIYRAQFPKEAMDFNDKTQFHKKNILQLLFKFKIEFFHRLSKFA